MTYVQNAYKTIISIYKKNVYIQYVLKENFLIIANFNAKLVDYFVKYAQQIIIAKNVRMENIYYYKMSKSNV